MFCLPWAGLVLPRRVAGAVQMQHLAEGADGMRSARVFGRERRILRQMLEAAVDPGGSLDLQGPRNYAIARVMMRKGLLNGWAVTFTVTGGGAPVRRWYLRRRPTPRQFSVRLQFTAF